LCGLTLLDAIRSQIENWLCHRWLQDTSKRKLAYFLIFFAPPRSCFPGLPEDDPTIDKKQAPRIL